MKFKALITAIICTLLGAWYLASSVGFDIHRDHHCGRVYIVSLLHGTSCDEIHPEDASSHCHHHGCRCTNEGGCRDLCPECGAHEDGDCEDCSDELEQLTVTGTDDTDTIVLSVPVRTVSNLLACVSPTPGQFRLVSKLRSSPAPPSRGCPSTDVLRV